jgi:hypothetical protein
MLTSESEDKSILFIIIYAALYLFLIFTAQSWITTFNEIYQKYIIKKEKPSVGDFLMLSVILSTIFVIAVYLVQPRLPLFK